jgi:hypothetical protein
VEGSGYFEQAKLRMPRYVTRAVDEIYGFFAGVSAQIVRALHNMAAPMIEVADGARSATVSWTD